MKAEITENRLIMLKAETHAESIALDTLFSISLNNKLHSAGIEVPLIIDRTVEKGES